MMKKKCEAIEFEPAQSSLNGVNHVGDRDFDSTDFSGAYLLKIAFSKFRFSHAALFQARDKKLQSVFSDYETFNEIYVCVSPPLSAGCDLWVNRAIQDGSESGQD